MKPFCRIAVFAFAGLAPLAAAPASAQDPRAEQAQLAELIRVNPTDYPATYRYVLISTTLRDYEAAIGALERLLMFNPNLSRAQKELGFLYARLGAYQTAALHLRAALAAPDLDPFQKAQIEAFLPDIEKQTQTSRWSGRLQIGFRSQSNANWLPGNALFLAGGVNVQGPARQRSDVNSFELVEIDNDTDLDEQRIGVFETRFRGYATQQFNLTRYNIGLLGLSAGPRFALPSEIWSGASVKAYGIGLTSLVGDINYLNAGGSGASVRLPLGEQITVEPGFEWRHLFVNNFGGPFSTIATLATGDAFTPSIVGVVRLTDDVRIETRAAFTRATAQVDWQASNLVDGQVMLRVDVDPPLPWIGRKWTLAPFGRIFHLAFDAANPFVDPFHARRDDYWSAGLAIEAPITPTFGFSGAVECMRNTSNIPNFNVHNVSVWFGPVARF